MNKISMKIAPDRPVDMIVGVGGAGGWIVQMKAKSPLGEDNPFLVLVDGDIVEPKNLERQLFGSSDVGRPKTRAFERLLAKAGWKEGACLGVPEYLRPGSDLYDFLRFQHQAPLRIYCCPDNHVARATCLQLADERGAGVETYVAVSGNEYVSASAEMYIPAWRDTGADPRVRHPEILTDKDHDPLAPPCTGEAVESAPQLAIANMNAAVDTAWLMDVWSRRVPKLFRPGADPALVAGTVDRTPVSIEKTGVTQLKILTLGDAKKLTPTKEENNE